MDLARGMQREVWVIVLGHNIIKKFFQRYANADYYEAPDFLNFLKSKFHPLFRILSLQCIASWFRKLSLNYNCFISTKILSGPF